MEKVLSNIDILCHIFSYLSFEDQCNIVRVSPNFREVIIDFVWKNKFEDITVNSTRATFPHKLALSAKIPDKGWKLCAKMLHVVLEENRFLKYEDFQEFINLTAKKIQTLQLTSFFETETPEKQPSTVDFGIDHKNVFENLSNLTFKYLVLSENDLKQLTISCPNLEKLSLDECVNIYKMNFVIGIDTKVDIMNDMKMLKYLKIKDPGFCLQRREHTMEILKINVNQLELYGTLLYEQKLKYMNVKQLKINSTNIKEKYNICELRIQTFFHQPYFDEFRTPFSSHSSFDEFVNKTLVNFNNLQKIKLKGSCIRINKMFFDIFSEKFNTLKYLSLSGFYISNFIPIYTLNELELSCCADLTWEDLKHILCDMKLKSFSSFNTRYNGTFKYFDISQTLEGLSFRSTNGDLENLLKRNLHNLRNLSYFRCDNEILGIMATDLPKLQKLEIGYFRNSKEVYSYLLDIFKHPSLTKLAINDYYGIYKSKDLHCDLPEVGDNIQTNILYLNISYCFLNFDKNYDFLLNLLNNNRKMKIKVDHNSINCLCLKNLMDNSKFPSYLKYVNVYGCKLGIKDLREDFENSIQKAQTLLNGDYRLIKDYFYYVL